MVIYRSVGISGFPPVNRHPKWLVTGYYLPLTDALNDWWQVRVGDGTHGNRLVSLHSNSETHKTAICDARLIYGRGGFRGYLYAVQL